MIWRVILFWLLGASLAWADLSHSSFVPFVGFCSNDFTLLQKETKAFPDERPYACTNAAGYVIKYGYDGNGNLTNLTYPGNLSVGYIYDPLNRATNVADWGSRQTVQAYDQLGGVSGVARPNGTERGIGSDDDEEPQVIVEQYTAGAMAIDYREYGWSNTGRLAWEFDAPLPHAYTPPSRTMTYDADNRLTNLNGNSVTVDADGNMTYGPGTNNTFLTYTYNARNQLTGAGGLTYGYDPAGNRTLMTNGSVITTNVIDPVTSRLLMRIKAGTTNYYIYGAGLLYEIDATATTTNTLFYHYDSRGSTIAITDGSGNITDRMEYGVFGMMTYHSGGTDTPFLYNGEYGVQTDPNGLLYMRARYYNPYICRFINADPSGFAGGLNQYEYADGDPVSEMDPFGLDAQGWGGQLATWMQEQIVNPLDGYDSTSTAANFVAYTDAGIIGGMADWFRLGQGSANAAYHSRNGWDRAIGIAQDVERAAGIATAVGGPVAGGLSGLSRVAGTAEAATSGAAVAAGEAYSAIGSTGQVGEQWLADNLGGESQVYFNTSQGARYVDQLADGIANESKVGYQSLSPSIQLQISKDTELLNAGRVDAVNWHFFQSPVTGLGGPSQPLLNSLQQNGINVIIH